MSILTRSLGARMAIMFSVLIAAVGVFMLAYFPSRMSQQAESAAHERAVSIARVMSTALGPAVEFDDPDNAAQILHWLSTTSDAEFGLVRRGNEQLLAVWNPDAVPSGKDWGHALSVEVGHHMMYVTTPIAATGGTLHLGFSLAHLIAERDQMRHTVAITTALVVTLGMIATLFLAAFLMRPILVLTRTARRIARGELPPQLPKVAGSSEVMELAAALRAMIERINEVSQGELLRASRQAGMAEVATGVLHNVGNVLTSVNATVELLREQIEELPLQRVTRLHELLSASAAAGTLDADRLAAGVKFAGVVAESLTKGRTASLKQLETLAGHVEHIKRVVAMQNAYARLRSAAEPTRIADVLSEAVTLGCPPDRGIAITAETAADLADVVNVDRHRILQILVNLVTNARDAVTEQGTATIAITAHRTADRLSISVRDTGVGIAPELAASIFGAGVTSKAHGHGYGLHSSALAAREMGGVLTCTSKGVGTGATFTLSIPLGGVP